MSGKLAWIPNLSVPHLMCSPTFKINSKSKCHKLCLPPPIRIIHTRVIIPDPGPEELQSSKTALLKETEPDVLNVFCGCK